MTSNQKGNIALGKAISYFVENQYVVSLPLNDTQYYDLIIEKNGYIQTVQVKFCGATSKTGGYICSLRTISGSTRQKSYTVTESNVHLLFCYCNNGDSYLIPKEDLKNINTITLFNCPQKNKQCLLDTYLYLL